MGREHGRPRLCRNGTAAREGLHLWSQEQGQIGRGDRGRVQRACKPFRKYFAKKESDKHQWQRFASTVSEPFRSGKRYGRGSQPVKPRSAKSAERLAATLRFGALTGRAHARKNLLAIFGMSLSASVGATPPQRGDPHPAKNSSAIRAA